MSTTPPTDHRLDAQNLQWQRKPVLRAIYNDLYRIMAEACVDGSTLEIGGGSGNFKSFAPNVISTDILPAPWLDLLADAQRLPIAESRFDNVVLFDVLHHIQWPMRFLREAERILKPGGRVVLVEPYISPISRIFYTWFHPEDVIMSADPMQEGEIDPELDAFEANQAIPTLLFSRMKAQFEAEIPGLSVLEVRRHSLFAYPLSGGFRPWSLIPSAIVPTVLALESRVMPLLGRLMAFRMVIILEKQAF
ncbi:MAG: class I SAM-dependent methyltransferase [Magnetococcales bacterium]|nr:class I SAM-dependent methyltransferase [Magnetococcales bacterium]